MFLKHACAEACCVNLYTVIKHIHITEMSCCDLPVCFVAVVSPPVTFNVSQSMDIAFNRLLGKFLDVFQRPHPLGPSLAKVKLWCTKYCVQYHHEKSNFDYVTSMESLFLRIAELKYCNFLNLGLLEHLSRVSNVTCLKDSVKNYNDTFYHTKVKDQVSTASGCTVRVIRKESRFKSPYSYARMFTKLIKRGMTYGQIKKFGIAFCQRIIYIHPSSTILYMYRRGCVCLGWKIPMCLVEAAYHAACTNTALFAQLGIKYVIIGQYKIEPPTTCVRGMLYS